MDGGFRQEPLQKKKMNRNDEFLLNFEERNSVKRRRQPFPFLSSCQYKNPSTKLTRIFMAKNTKE